MLQLLYGNDGMNYRTLAKSKEMTNAQEKELLSAYVGYDFVKDAGQYSSVFREPVTLIYATTNLSNQLKEERVLLGRSARLSTYNTPSYWSHIQLRDKSPNLYREEFTDLLRQSFIEDTELGKYTSETIDCFQPETLPVTLNDHAIEPEKLTVLVASLLHVTDSLSKQLALILDEEGDDYNARLFKQTVRYLI